MLCPQCRGAKKHAPLGHIEKTCNKCEGLGFIDGSAITHTDLPLITSPVDGLPLIEFDENEHNIKPKKKKKQKKQPVLHVDHPLSKLKDKIANANT